MGQLRVEVLGRPAVLHAGTPLALGAKATAVVCYLAVTGERQSRAWLASLLWGELPDDRARANLRLVLSDLRRALGGHLDISRTEVARREGWEVDLSELAEPAGADGEQVGWLRIARGQLLAGLDLTGAPLFDEWLTRERERVRHVVTDGLAALARTTADHDPEQALTIARELLALDSFDEAAHRLVMELLASTGRRGAALAQYETCRLVLADELGVDPSADTVALRDRLLADDGSVDRAGEPARTHRQDAGELDRSQVAGVAAVLHRLQVTNEPLVGRDADLQRIGALLADATCRLLTLVGPGGVGKTRLAIAAAESLTASFPDGVAFVPLAALPTNEPEAAVAGVMAQALDVPPGRDSHLEAIQRSLADRTMLIVLDNVEHLDVRALVMALLEGAPGLTLLATSRRRIGLGAEWLFDVGGLAYPATAGTDLELYPATSLFLARAQRVRPSFTIGDDPGAILRICQLVEGLPLAIELAADWMRSLEPREVADLISSDLDALATDHHVVEDRQRSMRSVLEATWRLLDATDHRILEGLSVFRGGFDADAAAAVAGGSRADLSRLVDRCVVQPRPGSRFDLHELLRQFAAERLAEDPVAAEAARRRHALHLAAVASALGPDVAAGDRRAMDALDADLANLRAATRWLIRHGDEDQLEACLVCLWQLDRHRNRDDEALILLEEALARPDVSAERAAAWHRFAGASAFQLGRMERALAELETAFAELGQPLPSHSAALIAAILREGLRQCSHRLLPQRRARTDGAGHAERIEMLSWMGNTLYFLQRPLPMLLYVLLEANAADHTTDLGAASCGYAELGHALTTSGFRRLGHFYGELADDRAARAPASELVVIGLESRLMSHLAVADWDRLDVQLAQAVAARTAARVDHRRLLWQAIAGVAALFRGEFADAHATFASALEESRTIGDELLFVWASNGVTDATLGLGDDLASVEPLQREAVSRSRGQAPPEQLKSAAVMAALRLAQGDVYEVRSLARTATTVVGDVRFFPVWALGAYGHLAHVWLALWDRARDPDPEVVRGARLACRQLNRFARAFPVGAPRASWAAGWLAWLQGRPNRARRYWRRSLDVAEGLRMPYEQARAHVAFADTSDDEHQASDHRARAQTLLAELDAHPALLHLDPSTAQLTLD